ncbi:MAG: hypothetical protein V4629_13950 [Pseudomonadota bacterium]
MYIDRLILMFVLGGYIVSPAIMEWASTPGASWYRPYAMWALIIGISFWVTRSRDLNEL